MAKFSALIITTLLISACGSEHESQLFDDSNIVSVEPGIFKLYDEKKPAINPDCDLYKEMQLINGFAGGLVTLENKLSGSCKILVRPRTMTFNLIELEAGCGSKRYEAIIPESNSRIQRVEVIDHRQRLCADLTPNQIVVKIHSGDNVEVLHSLDAPPTFLKKGTFTGIAGIGGESTGVGLVQNDGTLVELDLATNGLYNRFVESDKAAVKGFWKTIHGTETVRRVFVAVEIEAL
jgi:hypothetical protein